MKKIRSLHSQLNIFFWVFALSMVFCPTIGAILMGKGYEAIGKIVLFIPVAQLALFAALMFENLIDLERCRKGKKSFTPLSRLIFPEIHYIEKLYESGYQKEAIEYASAWLEPPKDERDF